MTTSNKKKPTLSQLQKKIENAVVFVERDNKSYNSVYFDDRGLSLEVTNDFAVVSRLSFRMIFNAIVPSGYSRIYLVIKKIIEMAQNYGCDIEKDGKNIKSFWTLWENVTNSNKGEIEKTEDTSILALFSSWLDVQHCSVFSLSERVQDVFTIQFMHKAFVLLFGVLSKPYDKDMTNVDIMKEFEKELKAFIKEKHGAFVVLQKETEEKKAQELANAMEQAEINNIENKEDKQENE